jgi:hypothetical protein
LKRNSESVAAGCLCAKKKIGCPGVSEEDAERVREIFTRSPKKSVRRVSRELQVPPMTVWKVLRKKLTMKLCPHDVAEVKERTWEATATVDEAMLGRVWQEFD